MHRATASAAETSTPLPPSPATSPPHLNTTTISTWRERRESLPTRTDLRSSPDRKPLPHTIVDRHTIGTTRPCRRLPSRDILVTDGGSPCHVRRSRSAAPDRRWLMDGDGSVFWRCGCRQRGNGPCPRHRRRGHGSWYFSLN